MLNYEKGLMGEERAKNILLKLGYEIIGQRIKNKYGEIDILAKKESQTESQTESQWHIIEVKLRKNFEIGANAISKKQLERSVNAFFEYARQNNLEAEQVYLKAIIITEKYHQIIDIDILY